jgi:hypothetical protein
MLGSRNDFISRGRELLYKLCLLQIYKSAAGGFLLHIITLGFEGFK